MKYILVDFANMFFRARHTAARGADDWTKLGMSVQTVIASANKVARDFEADHVVFCLEGRSWRKDFYEPYKKQRRDAREALSEAQRDEDKMFFEAFDDVAQFFENRTATSVIRCANAEADDVIARFIALHPDDDHIIVSSDSDFYQLISENVTQYNGIANHHITLNGVVDAKGKPVIDKKTNEQKVIGDPAWLLFEKCIRGDTSDNIFSAYPGVRKKGTKNKVGLIEAFSDRNSKGFNWNNLMLQRWVDHNGEEHRVLDDYKRNVALIDLSAQPADIKQQVDDAIRSSVNTEVPAQIGTHFLKFCGKYDLVRISEQAQTITGWMKKSYQGVLKNETASQAHT